jgi:putative FmdB family regulatory protein
MPIYEYACPKCGEFEVTQRITEEPLKKCPTCKSKVRKLISSTSFQLKGSGWYVTDYAKKGEKKSEGKEASASKDSGSGEATSSTESKPKEKSGSATSSGKTSKKEPAAKAA